jgi:putative ABC transport system ATP-binding protein
MPARFRSRFGRLVPALESYGPFRQLADGGAGQHQAMTDLIQLEHLRKAYVQGDKIRRVLDDAEGRFFEGEAAANRGRSGSGKTTLLNLLAGLDVPDAGRILVDGEDLGALSPRDRTLFRREMIGIVFQFFNLIPTLTVLENVLLPAELAGRAVPRIVDHARSLLVEVGLDGREREMPDRLSGGEQQRVAIARALVLTPRLVLADEPTGNLDQTTGDAIMRLLLRLTRAEGRTLILVTHSHHLAERTDRILTIEQGKLVVAAPAAVVG